MHKALLLSLTLVLPAGPVAYAQETSAQVVTSPEVKAALPENLVAPQQVYVVQNPAPAPTYVQAAPVAVAAPQVQTQPVTVIEDTPLRESRADQLRKSRIEVEQETESKIVEKLEAERMRAERERAEKIAKAFEDSQKPAEAAPAPAPVVAPVVQPSPFQYPAAQQVAPIAPVQYIEAPAPVISSEVLKEEIKEEKKDAKFFVGALGGFGDYPGVSNIRGIYAAGFNVGMVFPERLVLEGGALFSSYDVEQINYYFAGPVLPVIKQMDQMNLTAALKYNIIEGRVTPVAGIVGGYTRRTYSDRQYYMPTSDITSHAFDMGITGGADIEVAKNLTIGLDLRYMFNLSYRIDSTYQLSFANPNNGLKPVEEKDYYLMTVGARLQF